MAALPCNCVKKLMVFPRTCTLECGEHGVVDALLKQSALVGEEISLYRSRAGLVQSNVKNESFHEPYASPRLDCPEL